MPFRIITRQVAPLDASNKEIENGVDYLSHIEVARATSRLGRWNQLFDKIPLAVRQV